MNKGDCIVDRRLEYYVKSAQVRWNMGEAEWQRRTAIGRGIQERMHGSPPMRRRHAGNVVSFVEFKKERKHVAK
jgi:hypothetical protein